MPSWLEHGQQYHWRVSAGNYCGRSTVVVATFTTKSPAAILLVDDDDNSPDVSDSYRDTLDASGYAYDLWNTWNSDDEPGADQLAAFDIVIWFVGDEWQSAAGPGPETESALSSWLDAGKCLIVSGQDYLWNRGVTDFVTNYLGIAAFTSDLKHTSVTGAGEAFDGLGPYSLTYPFYNFSDALTPTALASAALNGDQGIAGVLKSNGVFKTTLWAFPFEAISSALDQQELMSAALTWCGSDVETYEIFLPLIER